MKKSDSLKKAGHYARAIFELSVEKGVLDKIAKDIDSLDKTLQASPDFIKHLSSFAVKDAEKVAVITEVSKKAKFHDYTCECLKIMAENKGIVLIPDFIKVFGDYYMEAQKVCKISVSTVKAMTPAQKKQISDSFKRAIGYETDIDENIDPDLLGGMIITYKSQRIDDSLKTKLERIKNTMKGTA